MKRLFSLLLLLVSVYAYSDIEVVVTASRIEENEGTVAGSVTVITDAEMEQSGAATVPQLLSRIPSVQFTSVSGGEQVVSMGGFGETGFGRVLVLVDGVPANRPDMDPILWAAIPVGSIERIEVLSGPASARYGDAAVAGVINIITRKSGGPAVRLELAGDHLFSNRQALRLSGNSGPVSASLDALRDQRNDSRDRSDLEMSAFSGKLEYNPSESLSLSLSGSLSPTYRQFPGSLPKQQFQDDPDKAGNPADEENAFSWTLSGGADLEAGDLGLSIPVSFSSNRSETTMAAWSSFYDLTIADYQARPQAEYDVFFGDTVYMTAAGGVDLRYTTLEIERFADAEFTDAFFGGDLSRRSAGFWIYDKLSFDERLILDGGFRYELAGVRAASETEPDLTGDVSAAPVAFDAGILWKPLETVSVNGRYGRVFRYPFLDEQASYSGSIFFPYDFYVDLEPETGHHFSASLSGGTGDFSVALDSNLILMDSEIVWDQSGKRNVNSDSTRHLGASLTAAYRTAPAALSIGYGFERAEFTKGAYSGKLIPLVPEHTVTVQGNAALPAGFSLSSSFRYTTGAFQGGDNANVLEKLPGRNSWDGAVSWKDVLMDGLSLSLSARNILDDRTPTVSYAYAYGSSVFEDWYPMPGRIIELGAVWEF